MGPDLVGVLRPRAVGAGRGAGLLDGRAMARSAGTCPRGGAARPEPPGARALPEPLGPGAPVLHGLRGSHLVHRAPALRDRVGLVEGAVRGVHAVSYTHLTLPTIL